MYGQVVFLCVSLMVYFDTCSCQIAKKAGSAGSFLDKSLTELWLANQDPLNPQPIRFDQSLERVVSDLAKISTTEFIIGLDAALRAHGKPVDVANVFNIVSSENLRDVSIRMRTDVGVFSRTKIRDIIKKLGELYPVATKPASPNPTTSPARPTEAKKEATKRQVTPRRKVPTEMPVQTTKPPSTPSRRDLNTHNSCGLRTYKRRVRIGHFRSTQQVEVGECFGSCPSFMPFTPFIPHYEFNCKCCKPNKMKLKKFEMKKHNGAQRFKLEIRIIIECTCQNCTSKNI